MQSLKPANTTDEEGSDRGDGEDPELRTDGGRRRSRAPPRRRQQGLADRVPFGLGIGLGIGAFVVNFLAIAAFVIVDFEPEEDVLTGIGWMLYGAHNVPIEASFGGETQSANYVQALHTSPMVDTTVPTIAYYVVPGAVLLIVGLLLGMKAAGSYGGSPLDGGLAGASMAISYVVLAVGGTFLFAESAGRGSTSPSLVMSVAIMGVGYPVVIGGLGGVLGYAMGS